MAGYKRENYESFHSYNLTRPYPYRWFSPIALIGGIIATVLFSLLNVASQGYVQYTESTTNPNATLADKGWLGGWPSFLVGTQMSCERSSFVLQSQIYTNNTALPFKVQRVWRADENGEEMDLGTLEYYNQPLQWCNVTRIFTEFDIRTSRSSSQIAMIPVGGSVTGETRCYFETEDGRTYLELLVIYDPVASTQNSMRYFVYSNQTRQANLYWANSIMRYYWADVMWKFAAANKENEDKWINGNVEFRPRHFRPGETKFTEDEIMDKGDDFFQVGCFLNQDANPDVVGHFDWCQQNNVTDLNSKAKNNGSLYMPEFWTSANILSKAMYFAILADLGRDDEYMPNLLSRPKLLERFTQGLTKTQEKLNNRSAFTWGIGGGVSNHSFTASDFPDVDLTVTPSVLSSSYLCKVRKIKSPLSLIISVLVADIVLLSSLWRTYVWVVDTFWVGKDATVARCACYNVDANGPLVAVEESMQSKPLMSSRT
ncbi:hypothetical protein NM208_g910 [Fusarium decemcellulare]|uniref:Uncharacterized protein n=1 Tax=Fusarium decemcellulare TaxID=57161 RepID=A0ACC1SXY9_9HYPO|nr:hypothetical protein NM208_g910 [Fusarium decemcellulare]